MTYNHSLHTSTAAFAQKVAIMRGGKTHIMKRDGERERERETGKFRAETVKGGRYGFFPGGWLRVG